MEMRLVRQKSPLERGPSPRVSLDVPHEEQVSARIGEGARMTSNLNMRMVSVEQMQSRCFGMTYFPTVLSTGSTGTLSLIRSASICCTQEGEERPCQPTRGEDHEQF